MSYGERRTRLLAVVTNLQEVSEQEPPCDVTKGQFIQLSYIYTGASKGWVFAFLWLDDKQQHFFSYMSSCGPSSCSSSCRWSCGGWWGPWEGWDRAECCCPGCWSLRWLWRKGRSHHSPELKGDIELTRIKRLTQSGQQSTSSMTH